MRSRAPLSTNARSSTRHPPRRSWRPKSRISRRPPRRAAARKPGEVLGVDDLQLGVACELEAVSVGARLEGRPESLRGNTLGGEVTEESVEGPDEVLGAVEPAEDLAADLAEDAAEDDG